MKTFSVHIRTPMWIDSFGEVKAETEAEALALVSKGRYTSYGSENSGDIVENAEETTSLEEQK